MISEKVACFYNVLKIFVLLFQVFNVAGVPIEWEEHYVGTEVDPRTEFFDLGKPGVSA